MKTKLLEVVVMLAIIVLGSLVFTACGKDDKSSKAESTPEPTETVATATPVPTDTPTPTPEATDELSAHGKLSVSGTQIVDKNGDPYQLKGVSTHGIQWFPDFVNKDAFEDLRDGFGANVVRLAMYVTEGGYLEGADQAWLEELIDNGVNYATELGMYVIIDWHTLNGKSNNPANYTAEAKEFFDKMSKKYADHDNVLYEICNEPNGGQAKWEVVREYAVDVIGTIRANDPDAIVIVGTPTWSQDVDKAAANPITEYDNLVYALHFYATTHTDWLRDRMVNAIKSGLPIFVSEFGICEASGNGRIDYDSANAWVKVMDENNVSYACWNLANKNEKSSMIKPDCDKKSGWTFDELSEEGQWLVKVLGGSLAQ